VQPYEEFLKTKEIINQDAGIEIKKEHLNKMLFDFQRDIVWWALKKGRAAIFADCGLGKTPMQLDWANQIHKKTGKDILILAPLVVSKQTKDEGDKFHIKVNICRHQEDVKPGINITNYEMLKHFEPSRFIGIVLDESSILKSYTGKFRTTIIEAFQKTPYRLACTATPAPNDYMELGNHSEFLGAMRRMEMLTMFFVHDGANTSQWRLKGHAEEEFWKWIASWAVVLRKPSDLGYEDDGFILPPLHLHEEIVSADIQVDDRLFPVEAKTLIDRRRARKESREERVQHTRELVESNNSRPWLLWCDLNIESEMLSKQIKDAVEVKGSDSRKFKEAAVLWFKGEICDCQLKLISKHDKLPAWEKKKNIKENTIKNTEKSDSKHPKNIKKNTEKSDKNICESMLKRIPQNLDVHQNNKQNIMLEEERNTQETKNYELKQDNKLENGNKQIQKEDLLKGLNHTESYLQNTENYSKSKMEVAQFAEQKNLQTTQQESQEMVSADSTLTTATKQNQLGDFFAHNVTSDLENSNTISSFLNKQFCTCGGIKQGRVLVSKPSIFGFGLNLQICSNVAFVGLSDSYERFYQAVRRCWRFGQKNPVNAHIIISDIEGAVLSNIKRKEEDAKKMADGLIKHTQELTKQNLGKSQAKQEIYKRDKKTGKNWTMYLGDCVDISKELETDSIHYSIFSPPFESLYTYTNSPRDMGNSKNNEEFHKHFKFLVKELYRVMMPGRLLSFHCMNLPMAKQSYGFIGLRDFRGELIQIFKEAGFIYHSEVCIWKDPVVAMQRTKALGLLYKQLRKDSAMCRQGIADYLITMRKHGENPERITHTKDNFSLDLWQNYASPIWTDINPSNTLQKTSAREHKDERHICPLQLDVIQRALELWTNPKDLVFSPFAGIGSEGYMALKLGRRFIGIEIKESYYKQAYLNLERIQSEKQTLF